MKLPDQSQLTVHCKTAKSNANMYSFSASNLPIPISDAASVQYKDTFLLVGGKTTNADLDAIFMYEPDTDTWVELEERLPEAKNDVVAVTVSRSMFAEC